MQGVLKGNSMEFWESHSEEETRRIARELGQQAEAGEIYCLDGDLGTGKTVFAKGFAEGLGVRETVTSPTFTLVREYKGRIPLYHFDVYRIGDSEELLELGYEDYFFGEGVCLIEWPERISELLPERVSTVTIKKDLPQGEDYRTIQLRKY